MGGFAVQRRGEPRLTFDVDRNLLMGFGQNEPLIDGLLRPYGGRIADAPRFALRHRVVLPATEDGVGASRMVDIRDAAGVAIWHHEDLDCGNIAGVRVLTV